MSVLSNQPNVLILYGATGDLAHRSVIPALYELACQELLPKDLAIIGNGRGEMSDDAFRDDVATALKESGMDAEPGAWDAFAQRCHFAGGGLTEDDPGRLLEVLDAVVGKDRRIIHYFAVPPKSFVGFTKAVKAHGLAENSRAVYEKPFGTSLKTFRQLDSLVRETFEDEQVFRIDHFVGKEGAQNIMAARFANKWLEDVWNRDYVESVQIDVPETLDIKDRPDFYDHTGAFLDMIVTHLVQVLGLVAMDEPVSMSEQDVRAARDGALACLRPLKPEDVVLGQFAGYRNTEGIAADSRTDTFAAVRMFVDSDRWRDVPFLLRTGKRMAKSQQRVSLVMRKPDGPIKHLPDAKSVITFDLRESGAMQASMVVKQPGVGLNPVQGTMRMDLTDVVKAEPLRAYARMIHDVIANDHTLFTTSSGLADVWRVADPFLDHLAEYKPQPHEYQPDTWGPDEHHGLAGPHGWVLS